MWCCLIALPIFIFSDLDWLPTYISKANQLLGRCIKYIENQRNWPVSERRGSQSSIKHNWHTKYLCKASHNSVANSSLSWNYKSGKTLKLHISLIWGTATPFQTRTGISMDQWVYSHLILIGLILSLFLPPQLLCTGTITWQNCSYSLGWDISLGITSVLMAPARFCGNPNWGSIYFPSISTETWRKGEVQCNTISPRVNSYSHSKRIPCR